MHSNQTVFVIVDKKKEGQGASYSEYQGYWSRYIRVTKYYLSYLQNL